MKYLLPLLFCLSTVCAEEQIERPCPSSPLEISDLSSSKEKLLGGMINPLSGQASLKKTDLIVKGAQEIRLDRTYIAPFLPVKLSSKPDLVMDLIKHYRGWETLSHLNLWFSPITNQVLVVDQNGSILEFKKSGQQCILQSPSYGMCNLGQDNPSCQADQPVSARFAAPSTSGLMGSK